MNGTLQTNYASLGLLVIPLATVLGNLLVIVSVVTVKNLHIRINYLILSLAFTDLILAMFVMPFAVYLNINGYWGLGILLCDLWLAGDVTCSTASILLLALISYDRFQAATRPLEYANSRKSTSRIAIAVVLCWLCSASIASPVVLGLNWTPERLNKTRECLFYDENFLLMSSVASFYLPTVLILVLYYRIFKVIRERGKMQRQRAKVSAYANMSTTPTECLNNNRCRLTPPAPVKHSPPLLAVTLEVEAPSARIGHSVSFQDTADVASFRPCDVIAETKRHRSFQSNLTESSSTFTVLDDDICFIDQSPERVEPRLALPESFDTPVEDCVQNYYYIAESVLSESEPAVVTSRLASIATESTRRETLSSAQTSRRGTSSSNITSSASFEAMHAKSKPWVQLLMSGASTVVNASAAMFSLQKEEDESTQVDAAYGIGKSDRKGSKKHLRRKMAKANQKERKATKTLTVVLGVYLMCWCPFFATNLTNAICIKLKSKSPSCELGTLPFFLTTWLGYMNSFMNPVIYTIFSGEFRRAFRQVLCVGSSSQASYRRAL